MSAKLENVKKNVVKLTIEVDAETFEKCMEQSYNKNKNRFSIQGFRKGKAPRSMVERVYGESALYEDAIDFACPDAYTKAIDELGLDPVSRPEIDVEQIGNHGSLIFTAEVTLKPELVLGQYKGLDVKKEPALVTEDDIEKELKRLQDRNSRMIAVEDRTVLDGDTLSIDFEGFVDGVAFDGGLGKDYTLVIGSNSFIPGFESQLIGAELNKEVEINVEFPAEYHSADLAGKPAMFKVTVKDIKCKEMPELDDEFAKDVSEFETLEEYKVDIRSKLVEKADEETKHKFEDAVLKAACDLVDVEIPDVMVEKQLDQMLRQFDMNLRYQGMSLEKYMSMMGMEEAQMRADFRESAAYETKLSLMLEEIVKAEKFETTDEDLEAELVDIAKQYGKPVEDLKKQLHDHDMENIRASIDRKKAIKMMVDSAVA